jgi:pimeloyl-ACP methyl ester carboxylesterase
MKFLLGALMAGAFAGALVMAAGQAAAPPDFVDQFVIHEGRRVHYLEWGTADRPAFVMLHGIGRSAHSYDHIARALRDRYRVIAMDLRGHGDSDWHAGGAYLVEDYVTDLEHLADELGLDDIVMTGSSTGGRVAQVYAGLHPDRVSKLIVEDVGPERPASIARGFAGRAGREREGWASEDALLASLRGGQTRVSEGQHRNWIRYETRRLPDGRVAWKYDPNVSQGFVPTELWEHVRRITAPTLYLLGANSSIVPPETQRQLKATSPTIEVVTVPDAGHYPHQETPDVFLAVVRAFLAG